MREGHSEAKAIAIAKKLTLPDWLSISRIIGAPIILILTYFNLRMACASLVFICFITDALDGYIARKFNLTSELGAKLDSIGDALNSIAAIIATFHFETEFFLQYKNIIFATIAFYYVEVLLALIKYKRPTNFHTALAKGTSILHAVFLSTALFFQPITWLFYATIGITLLETLEEIILIFMLNKWQVDVKGVFWVLKNKRKF